MSERNDSPGPVGMEELLVAGGLAMIAAALWLAWGWPTVLAYVGVLLVVVGLILAWRKA